MLWCVSCGRLVLIILRLQHKNTKWEDESINMSESSAESVGSCWKAVFSQFVLQGHGLLSKMKGQWYQKYTSEVCIFGARSEHR